MSLQERQAREQMQTDHEEELTEVKRMHEDATRQLVERQVHTPGDRAWMVTICVSSPGRPPVSIGSLGGADSPTVVRPCGRQTRICQETLSIRVRNTVSLALLLSVA